MRDPRRVRPHRVRAAARPNARAEHHRVLPDAHGERGVLGLDTRADTVDDLCRLLALHGADPLAWYGVWLFSDWMSLDGDADALPRIAEVELAASRRDPYRRLSRVFHLLATRSRR